MTTTTFQALQRNNYLNNNILQYNTQMELLTGMLAKKHANIDSLLGDFQVDFKNAYAAEYFNVFTQFSDEDWTLVNQFLTSVLADDRRNAEQCLMAFRDRHPNNNDDLDFFTGVAIATAVISSIFLFMAPVAAILIAMLAVAAVLIIDEVKENRKEADTKTEAVVNKGTLILNSIFKPKDMNSTSTGPTNAANADDVNAESVTPSA